MQNSEQILVYSFMAILVATVAIVLRGTISAYGATLGSSKFKYRFVRSRLPLAGYAIATLAVLSFGYGFVVSRNVGLAAEFCLLATIFGGISCILGIAYVPKKADK